jgi:hypothetical protein
MKSLKEIMKPNGTDRQKSLKNCQIGMLVGLTGLFIPAFAPLVTDTVLPTPLALGLAGVGGGTALIANAVSNVLTDDEKPGS